MLPSFIEGPYRPKPKTQPARFRPVVKLVLTATLLAIAGITASLLASLV